VRISDVKIFGEGDGNFDCPEGQAGYRVNKYGFMTASSNFGAKALHPDMPSQLPIYKIKSYGSWGASAVMQNVRFIDWASTTRCGLKQVAIKRNPNASDYIPLHKWKNTVFDNVQENAVIYIDDPDEDWANPTDCGAFPCTAPNNIVMQFTGT